MGMNVTIVCPDHSKYSPSSEIIEKVEKHSKNRPIVSHNPKDGVSNADVIYTDVWISAGMEEEKKERMKVFPPFQVNSELLESAKPDCIVIHCLPAHRGFEITSEVMDLEHSVVFEQAGNRMHAQKGLLFWLLKN